MFRKITHVVYKCPNTFSPQLQSLISGLLEKHVSRRLGSGVTGALEVGLREDLPGPALSQGGHLHAPHRRSRDCRLSACGQGRPG